MQNPAQTFVKFMHLIETGHLEVNADGDPDLGLHRVLAGAVKRFDAEVLLDPFKEQLDLPATFVEVGDAQGGQVEVIGEEDEALLGCGVDEADAPEFGWVVALAFGDSQTDDLVAAQPCPFVHRTGLADVESKVALGSGDEKSFRLLDEVKPAKIDVAAVHDIDASRLEGQLVEHLDVGCASVCNADEHWDGAAQVHQRMQFDSGLGLSEIRPGKGAQTQVDGAGIQGVNHLVEVQNGVVLGVETPRPADEHLGQVGVNAPVAMLVGVGQVRAGHVAAKAHRVEVRGVAQAGLDIAQTLPKSHLGKGHRQKLIASGKGARRPRHRVAGNAACKFFGVEQVDNLTENGSSGVHSLLRLNPERFGDSIQMQDNPILAQEGFYQ